MDGRENNVGLLLMMIFKDMYRAYSSKAEIFIWCFLPGKTATDANKRKKPLKHDTIEKRTKCVASIEDKMSTSWLSFKVNMERNSQ